MSQHPGPFPVERPTPLVGVPTPIDPSPRAVYIAPRPSRSIRLMDAVATAVTPRRIVIGVALAVLALLLIRGIEIRISEIIIHLGR